MSENQELKFSRDHSFFDRSLLMRWLITLFLAVGVFSFVHFREVHVEVLELDTRAPEYIIAEVNFAFPDEEATTLLRQQALSDLGKIYAVDADSFAKRRNEFQNFLIHDEEWRKAAKDATYDEMLQALNLFDYAFASARFSDTRTILKMKELGFDTAHTYELPRFDPSLGAYFPQKVWDSLRAQAFEEEPSVKNSIDYLITYFRPKIWLLKPDLLLEKKLEKTTLAEIPMKYTEVMAGSRMIDRGEKVSARHVAMMQAMRQTMIEKRELWTPRALLASAVLTALIILIAYAFLETLHPEILASNKRLFLLVSIALLGLGFAKVTEFVLLRTTENLFEIVRYPLLTPFLAILATALISPSVALFIIALAATLFDSVLVINRPGFMLVNILIGFFVILFMKTLRKRTEIFAVSTKAWVAASFLIAALHCYGGTKIGTTLLTDLGSAAIFMAITSILVVGLLPLFEAGFGILTDITLMEYMDPSHELLRRLTVEAPGTYQHALIMGNIAESAARAIGANGLFCRVATLYHDIGKMAIAQYFTENQQHGVNIHQLLTPVESAEVIISHVQEGVQLARRARLPEQFVDIIKEHHGTSLVYYFYRKQLELVGGKKELVNEKEFRYSGPKPRTKESVVIMIADSVEAASRSLDEVNEATLTRLVDDIVREKQEDGQFDDSHLTFEELQRVKRAIIKSLLSIGHFRVKYPSRIRKDASAIQAGLA